MTESCWLESVHPKQMLEFLDRRMTQRQTRLLAAAFCRHIEDLITPERGKRLLVEGQRFGVFYGEFRPGPPDCLLRAVEDVERCADGLISVDVLAPANVLADRLSAVGGFYFDCYVESWGPVDYDLIATCEAATAVHDASSVHLHLERVATHASRAVYYSSGGTEEKQGDASEDMAQCGLIRELIPFPKRQVAFTPAWRTSDVMPLARGIYDERAFDRMPILADALQDSGCDSDDILNHLRDPHATHVRGCWALDLVLSKE